MLKSAKYKELWLTGCSAPDIKLFGENYKSYDVCFYTRSLYKFFTV